MGGQRYVDLGLGTHRVKCRVHEDFKYGFLAFDLIFHISLFEELTFKNL